MSSTTNIPEYLLSLAPTFVHKLRKQKEKIRVEIRDQLVVWVVKKQHKINGKKRKKFLQCTSMHNNLCSVTLPYMHTYTQSTVSLSRCSLKSLFILKIMMSFQRTQLFYDLKGVSHFFLSPTMTSLEDQHVEGEVISKSLSRLVHTTEKCVLISIWNCCCCWLGSKREKKLHNNSSFDSCSVTRSLAIGNDRGEKIGANVKKSGERESEKIACSLISVKFFLLLINQFLFFVRDYCVSLQQKLRGWFIKQKPNVSQSFMKRIAVP